MEHEIETVAGTTVLRLHGAVDVSAAIELRELLGERLGRPSARVLVDLADVRLVDSSGVGIFVTAHRRAADRGARFALAAPRSTVARVFELTRTDRLLTIHPSVDAGLAAMRDG
jgi:anti-anti-sigma factor